MEDGIGEWTEGCNIRNYYLHSMPPIEWAEDQGVYVRRRDLFLRGDRNSEKVVLGGAI